MDTSSIVIELGGIRATTTVIEELDDDGTPLVSFDRREITALRVDRGYVSERPFAGLTLGLLLIAFGLFVGAELIRSLFLRDTYFGRRAAFLLSGCATALLIGVWLARHATRQGPFLAVSLRSEMRKLALRPGTSSEEIARLSEVLSGSSHWAGLMTP